VDNPVISHDFVRTLSKKIRAAFGKEVPHTQVLDMIAESLNWRTDALMHKLKSATSAETGREAPDSIGDETLRRWVILRSWRQSERAAATVFEALPKGAAPVSRTMTEDCVASFLAVCRIALGDMQGAHEALADVVSDNPSVALTRCLYLYKRFGETAELRSELTRIGRAWPEVSDLVNYPRTYDVDGLEERIAVIGHESEFLEDWESLIQEAFTHLAEPGFLGLTYRMFLDGNQIPTGLDQSVGDDTLMCLFDGQRRKMMKRYLESKYGMSPADYRAYWGLPDDYPMVAPGYAAEKGMIGRAAPTDPS